MKKTPVYPEFFAFPSFICQSFCLILQAGKTISLNPFSSEKPLNQHHAAAGFPVDAVIC